MHQKLSGLDPARTETCFLEQQLLLITHVWNLEQDHRALWWNWVGQFVLGKSNIATWAIRMNLLHFTWCPRSNSVCKAACLFGQCFPGAKKLISEVWAWRQCQQRRISSYRADLIAAVLVVPQLGTWGKSQGMSGFFLMSLVSSDSWVVRALGSREKRKSFFFEVEQKLHKLRTWNMSLI